jgi:hypothetical protein
MVSAQWRGVHREPAVVISPASRRNEADTAGILGDATKDRF